jgi:N-acetylmuramoyl-L-alanine amidase
MMRRKSLAPRRPGKIVAGLLVLGALSCGYSLGAPIEWPDASPHKRPPNSHPIIVIDPGHGGSPGSVSRNGINEKDITLDIALKLETLIKQEGTAEVFLTRRTDRSMSLVQRREFANEKRCDLFVSLHANASRLRRRNRIEVYYSSPWSRPLARAIGEQLSSEFQLEHRLEDVAWTVLWDNWAPLGAALIETMYLTHEGGEKILASEEGRQRIAASVFRALEKTLSR